MPKILITDDETNIRTLIGKYAHLDNIETDEASNGFEAIEKVKNNNYDLVIMDIMMPELDGFSAVKEIRKFSKIPVIMLSSRSEEYDKLYGFELGIDDYVTKPFSSKELIMRVHAVIGRYKNSNIEEKPKEEERKIWSYKTLKIDLTAYIVYVDDIQIDLTPKEYELLVYLCQNAGRAVTREKLLSKVWGYDYFGDDRTLDTHIKSLRKKIGEYSDNITTIRRVGYRFDAK